MEEQLEKQADKGAFSPREFVLKYLKFLPWIILSCIMFMVLAYVKLRYATVVYEVSAKLLIKSESGGSQDRLNDLFMMNENQNLVDEMEVLKSTGLSKRVASALGLQTSYYNIGKVKTGSIHPHDVPFVLEIISLKDSSQGFSINVKFQNESTIILNDSPNPLVLGQVVEHEIGKLRFKKGPVDYVRFGSNEFIVNWEPLGSVAATIAGSFQIAPINDFSNVLRLAFQSDNPKLGSDILNQLMLEYNKLIVEDKRTITAYTLQFIDERLDTIKAELGGVEQNLQRFRETNRAIDLPQQSGISLGEFNENNRELAEQEVQLKVLGYLQNYLADDRNIYKTVPSQLGINESSLQALINQYNTQQLQRETELKTTTELNIIIQRIDASLAKLRQQMIESLANIRQSYIIRRNDLMQKIRQTEGDISSVPGKTKRVLEITRQQKILEDLYSFLLQKKLETSISSASTISNSKVLEPAPYATVPVSPNRRGVYTLALVLGLGLPVSLIFIKELLNDKIGSRTDVEKLTSAPILGEIGHSQEQETLVVTKNNRRFIGEQFRIIRTNLQYILNKIESPVLLVTSSFSGEGKSFVSTNIGAVMALAGKKTVILEFDIRKPKIIAGLDLSRKSGITNFIVGKVSPQDIILPVRHVENLFVIPCGPVPPNPAELLLDEKVKELFVFLRKEFDVVIIDSAPIGLVSDASILSGFADATLYIVRQNYTLKKQVKMINELYVTRKLPKISILINDVKDASGTNKYYGGYGYGRDSGYFEQEKKKSKNLFSFIKSIFP